MKKVKKIISILVVAIMTVGLMAGCGKEKTDPNVLTVAHCQGEWLWPTLEKITSEYLKQLKETGKASGNATFVSKNGDKRIWLYKGM